MRCQGPRRQLSTHSSEDSCCRARARLFQTRALGARVASRASLPCNCVLALLSPRLGWSRMRHKDTIPLTSACEEAPDWPQDLTDSRVKVYGHPRHAAGRAGGFAGSALVRAVAHLRGGMLSARRHASSTRHPWRRRRADADKDHRHTSTACVCGITLTSAHRSRSTWLARHMRILSSALTRPAPVLYFNSYIVARLDRVIIGRAYIIHFNIGARTTTVSLFASTTSLSAEHARMMSTPCTCACTTLHVSTWPPMS